MLSKTIFTSHISYKLILCVLITKMSLSLERLKYFWSAIRVALIVQRFFGISPFHLDSTSKLITSKRTVAYSAVLLIIYMFCVSFATYTIWSSDVIVNVLFTHGYVFIVVSFIDLMFTKLSYIFIVVFSEANKHYQIQFYEKIKEIDSFMCTEFKRNINYELIGWHNTIGLFIGLGYFQALVLYVSLKLHLQNYLPTFGMVMFCIVFQYDQMAMFMNAWAFGNCVSMIKLRYQELLMALRQQHSVQNGITAYKQLFIAVQLLNKNNCPIVVRYIHDFTIMTTQLYMLFWLMLGHSNTIRLSVFVALITFIMHNILKIGVTTWLAHLAMQQVLL